MFRSLGLRNKNLDSGYVCYIYFRILSSLTQFHMVVFLSEFSVHPGVDKSMLNPEHSGNPGLDQAMDPAIDIAMAYDSYHP